MIQSNRKNLLIVDTRPFSAYAESHIPGAVNIDLIQFHWIDTSKSGILHFNRQSRLLLSNIGVSKEKFVVFYDDISGMSASRGVWLLLYFSHKKVAMLDGGLKKWKEEGHRVETKTTNPFRHSNFRGMPDPKVLADFAYINSVIRRRKKKKSAIIVDVRSKDEYNGSAIRASRSGHIPSAINIDWNDNLEQSGDGGSGSGGGNGSNSGGSGRSAGAFKNPEDLRRMYNVIPKDVEVITYCQGGYRAANTFVALKMLGYQNVRMYLGSWGEWGNKQDLPVEKG